MFHYRNHGAAYGRILVGVQVPKSERGAFEQVLADINYRYWDETDNRAYQLYLGQRTADNWRKSATAWLAGFSFYFGWYRLSLIC